MANEVRLIDANALLQSEIERCGRIPSVGSNYFNEECIDRILDKAPTIDPEILRPKGRWVESLVIQTDISSLYDYTCSECSVVVCQEFNYCPKCGADMQEGCRAGEMHRWIPACTPPAVDEKVLVLTQRGTQMVGHYSPRFGKWRVGGSAVVTHWMPLPEPPRDTTTQAADL